MRVSRFGSALLVSGALEAGFVVVAGTTASAVGNPVEYSGNVTTCAQVNFAGSTWYEGTVTSSVGGTAWFAATVTQNKFVTISAVATGVTFQAVVVKGGNGYNVYNPPVLNMQSPLNGGDNIPDLSHWFACYTYDPPVTTVAPTTTTIAPTTTTIAVTTTTEQDSGPPTTVVVTTTTDPAGDDGQRSLAPLPTTTVRGALPITGNGQASGQLLLIGFLLMGFGSVVLLLSRRPANS